MRERRQTGRIPLCLEVELKRGGWEPYVTEEVSRRGMFIRAFRPPAVGQVLQARIMLPGQGEPLEALVKVSRRVVPADALAVSRMPGLGIEFFCLGGRAIKRWEQMLELAVSGRKRLGEPDRYALFRALEQLPAPVETGGSRTGEAGEANLIFRSASLARLKRFIEDDLASGQVLMSSACPVEEQAPVQLRVVHPRSEEEFLFRGTAHRLEGNRSYLVQLEPSASAVTDAFRRFVFTGEAPAQLGGA